MPNQTIHNFGNHTEVPRRLSQTHCIKWASPVYQSLVSTCELGVFLVTFVQGLRQAEKVGRYRVCVA